MIWPRSIKGEDARRDMCLTLEEMGFEIEASHHEVAEGQHEIDFKYADALTTADNIMTFQDRCEKHRRTSWSLCHVHAQADLRH